MTIGQCRRALLAGLALTAASWSGSNAAAQTSDAAPQAVWTPSAEAPEGLMSPLTAGRHDEFIERARTGNIDIVFFGSTDTEKWRWPMARDVWEEAFGSRRAANFGSQGTGYSNLMWRMRNGELDGYQAKLIVLNPALGFGGDLGYASSVAAIIEQVRARQPQAKILLVGPLPRSVGEFPWRSRNAALAALADDETVFFLDISHRFFHPDGSFNYEMSALGGSRTPAYEAWAEELEPWIERFVD